MGYSSLSDYEKECRAKLPPMVLDYYAGGALDELTIKENEAAFRRVRLVNRVLRAAIEVDTSIELLGQSLSMPLLIAPCAFQGLAHPDGELATARAAREAGTVMVLSTTSNHAAGPVAEAADGKLWFQLYMMKDRGVTVDLVECARSAGCRAIVLTVDVPAWGRRERDMRNGFALPPGLVIGTMLIPGREAFYDGTFSTDLGTFINERFKFDLTWEDVAWLRSITDLPIVLKGIGHPDDARLAVEHGAAAVIVSNHGGRQLDSSAGTIDVLPGIVNALGGRIPAILDGGVRRGTDVIKALALGAKAVCVGRPVLWGLSVGGQQGVTDVLEILRAETRNTMTLCGCKAVSDITPQILRTTVPALAREAPALGMSQN